MFETVFSFFATRWVYLIPTFVLVFGVCLELAGRYEEHRDRKHK